jgi:glycerophosphoryl diester phosphodiesterase
LRPRAAGQRELKTIGLRDPAVPALVRRVSAILDRTATASRVLVSSFSPWRVALARTARRAGGAALREGGRRPPAPRLVAPAPASIRAHPDQRLCTPELIERLHRAGYVVNTWTVDDPARLRELRGWGSTG